MRKITLLLIIVITICSNTVNCQCKLIKKRSFQDNVQTIIYDYDSQNRLTKTELRYDEGSPQENYAILYSDNSNKGISMKALLNDWTFFSFSYRNDTLIHTEDKKAEGLRYPSSNDYIYKEGKLTLIITKFDYMGSLGILETELFYEGKNLVKIISNDKAEGTKKVVIENVKYDTNKNWQSNSSFRAYVLTDFIGAENFPTVQKAVI